MKSRFFFIAAIGLAAGLAAAEPTKIKDVVAKAPPSVADKANVKSAIFKKFQSSMLASERIGEIQGGWFCATQGQYVLSQRFLDATGRVLSRAFRAEMTKAGYPKPPQADSVFESAQKQAADFDVGALLRNIKMNTCNRSGEILGGAYVEVKWELFSPRAQKVVFELTTEGSYQNSSAGRRIPDQARARLRRRRRQECDPAARGGGDRGQRLRHRQRLFHQC